MAISVTPLHPHLGASVEGVDLTKPVSPRIFTQIEAAFNTHAVLIFPGQPVNDEQQIAFSRLFGPLEHAPNYAGETQRRVTRPEMTEISNLDSQGEITGPSSPTCAPLTTPCRRTANTVSRVWSPNTVSSTPTGQTR